MKTGFNSTPGPWKVNKVMTWHNGTQAYEVNFGEDGECVSEVVHGIENAYLISAAPELITALLECVNAMYNGDPNEPETKEVWLSIIKQSESAINKALNINQ